MADDCMALHLLLRVLGRLVLMHEMEVFHKVLSDFSIAMISRTGRFRRMAESVYSNAQRRGSI
jgi:hypothetical protein